MGLAISLFKKSNTPVSPKSDNAHDATIHSVKSDSDKVTNIYVQIVGDDAQSVNVKKSACTQTEGSQLDESQLKDVGNQTDRLDILSFRDFTEDGGIYDSSPPNSYRCELSNLTPRTSTVNTHQKSAESEVQSREGMQKHTRLSGSVSVVDMDSETEDDVTLNMDETINVPTASPNVAYKSLDFGEHDRNTNTVETPISNSCIVKGYYETKENIRENSIHADKGTQYIPKVTSNAMTQTAAAERRAYKERHVQSNGSLENSHMTNQQNPVSKQHSGNVSSQTIKSGEYVNKDSDTVYTAYRKSMSPYMRTPTQQERSSNNTSATQTHEANHVPLVTHNVTSTTIGHPKHTNHDKDAVNLSVARNSVTTATQTENKSISLVDNSKINEKANKYGIIGYGSGNKYYSPTQTEHIPNVISNAPKRSMPTVNTTNTHMTHNEIQRRIPKEKISDCADVASRVVKKTCSVQTQTVEHMSFPVNERQYLDEDSVYHLPVAMEMTENETNTNQLMKSEFRFAPMRSPSSSAPPTSPASDISDEEAILVNHNDVGARELRVYIPTAEGMGEMAEYEYGMPNKPPLTPIPEEEKSVLSIDERKDSKSVQYVKVPVREYSAKTTYTQTSDSVGNTPDVTVNDIEPNHTTAGLAGRHSQQVRKSPEVIFSNAQVVHQASDVTLSYAQPIRKTPDVTFSDAQPIHKKPEATLGRAQKMLPNNNGSVMKHGGFNMHRENSGSSDTKSDFELRFDLLNKQDTYGYPESVIDRSARTINEENISITNTPEIRSPSSGNITNRSGVDSGMKKIGKCKIKLASDNENCILTAATFMENGGVVIVDRANKKVKFIDAKFQFISQVEVTKRPWGACAIGKDIFVTIGKTKIQQITLDQEMVLDLARVIETKERCFGIAAYEDRLAIGLQRGQICLMSLSGDTAHMINLPFHKGKFCNPWHLCVTKDKHILVTDAEAEVVFCINERSEVLFHYTEMSSPRACTVDLLGNIIVVGRDGDTGDGVHLMQDGTREKTLMPWWNLEFVPYCVTVRADDGVIIMGGIKDAIQIYKYTSGE